VKGNKMKVEYKTLKLQKKTLKLIEQANEIIEEYQAQGFTLTVRQIYYQFVARGWILNDPVCYGYVGAALNKGRMAGLIDWWAIEDRTRFLRGNTHWDNPTEILHSVPKAYQRNSRETQDYLVEVWIEKDALVGVIDSVCRELDVDFFACKGYNSLSKMWRAARRLQCAENAVILHLGDHDPSGIDMTRDIEDRLVIFGCENLEVRRIALTMAQIEEFKPPPNPAKLSDSRARDYITEYGMQSWELDALAPDVLEKLIREHVEGLTDEAKRQAIIAEQENEREQLEYVAENWRDLEI